MAIHPAEFKKLVDSGESVIFKGRVVNKVMESTLPSASELASDDVVRKQFAVDIEREIADKQRELAELKSPVTASAPDETSVPNTEASGAEEEKKVVRTGRRSESV